MTSPSIIIAKKEYIMKRNIINLTALLFIFLIFKNYSIVLDSTLFAVDIWLKKVFPYLFIMIILNDILVSCNFSSYFKNPSSYVFIMSLLSGTPTSAYITQKMVSENQISKNYGNTLLLFTYFCNPLFLYTILNSIFNSNVITIKLMIIHYLSNIIIYLLNKKKLEKVKLNLTLKNVNISSSIKYAITTVTMVLGSITFYLIITNIIINTFNLPFYLKIFFRGILEVTQGLNSLIGLNIIGKELIAIIFISFGGFSIHTQVKCILDDGCLEYKYFLKGRIYQTIIALFLTICSYAINL